MLHCRVTPSSVRRLSVFWSGFRPARRFSPSPVCFNPKLYRIFILLGSAKIGGKAQAAQIESEDGHKAEARQDRGHLHREKMAGGMVCHGRYRQHSRCSDKRRGYRQVNVSAGVYGKNDGASGSFAFGHFVEIDRRGTAGVHYLY